MDTDRFSNVLGEEYNLFGKSVPHHDEFQDAVAGSIGRHAASLQTDTIRVVEGGCGTGITTARILEADERIVALGIDNEEKTIRQAQAVLQEYGNRVELRYEDLLAALQSLPDASADVFASPSSSLHADLDAAQIP
jgi:ubiquinone/menaquinone biosynthesis C-methylase UbiE